ncbi:hypothetical protein PBRA_000778 [Plasmodiophora brassicae]|uniref:Uncharacterized protein n=1 Tax=Plasmodiophora brassicae TaxID=37360 RepID=A0A0G4IPZ2_PLABS|nr:hypothetical protein PBRA_000778 [Plasmodiophora brassicae]
METVVAIDPGWLLRSGQAAASLADNDIGVQAAAQLRGVLGTPQAVVFLSQLRALIPSPPSASPSLLSFINLVQSSIFIKLSRDIDNERLWEALETLVEVIVAVNDDKSVRNVMRWVCRLPARHQLPANLFTPATSAAFIDILSEVPVKAAWDVLACLPVPHWTAVLALLKRDLSTALDDILSHLVPLFVNWNEQTHRDAAAVIQCCFSRLSDLPTTASFPSSLRKHADGMEFTRASSISDGPLGRFLHILYVHGRRLNSTLLLRLYTKLGALCASSPSTLSASTLIVMSMLAPHQLESVARIMIGWLGSAPRPILVESTFYIAAAAAERQAGVEEFRSLSLLASAVWRSVRDDAVQADALRTAIAHVIARAPDAHCILSGWFAECACDLTLPSAVFNANLAIVESLLDMVAGCEDRQTAILPTLMPVALALKRWVASDRVETINELTASALVRSISQVATHAIRCQQPSAACDLIGDIVKQQVYNWCHSPRLFVRRIPSAIVGQVRNLQVLNLPDLQLLHIWLNAVFDVGDMPSWEIITAAKGLIVDISVAAQNRTNAVVAVVRATRHLFDSKPRSSMLALQFASPFMNLLSVTELARRADHPSWYDEFSNRALGSVLVHCAPFLHLNTTSTTLFRRLVDIFLRAPEGNDSSVEYVLPSLAQLNYVQDRGLSQTLARAVERFLPKSPFEAWVAAIQNCPDEFIGYLVHWFFLPAINHIESRHILSSTRRALQLCLYLLGQPRPTAPDIGLVIPRCCRLTRDHSVHIRSCIARADVLQHNGIVTAASVEFQTLIYQFASRSIELDASRPVASWSCARALHDLANITLMVAAECSEMRADALAKLSNDVWACVPNRDQVNALAMCLVVEGLPYVQRVSVVEPLDDAALPRSISDTMPRLIAAIFDHLLTVATTLGDLSFVQLETVQYIASCCAQLQPSPAYTTVRDSVLSGYSVLISNLPHEWNLREPLPSARSDLHRLHPQLVFENERVSNPWSIDGFII